MNRTKLFLIIIILLFWAGKCDRPVGVRYVERIWVKNNADFGIAYLISTFYPDTLIPDNYDKMDFLSPEQNSPNEFHDKTLEEFFDGLPMDTLSLFFFHRDTLSTYSFEEIRNGYKILERRDISLEYLKENNYSVSYP